MIESIYNHHSYILHVIQYTDLSIYKIYLGTRAFFFLFFFFMASSPASPSVNTNPATTTNIAPSVHVPTTARTHSLASSSISLTDLATHDQTWPQQVS